MQPPSPPDFYLKSEIDNPIDTVSIILWNIYQPHELGFFLAGWDGFARYYEIKPNQQIVKVWEYYYSHPVLTLDFTPEMILIVGLANGQIVVTQFANSANTMVLGAHAAPICSLIWIKQNNVLVSFGYDHQAKIWNFQQNAHNSPVVLNLPQKTYTASYSFPYILVGSAQSRIHLYDVRNLHSPFIPQKYQEVQIEKGCKICCSAICSEVKKILLGGVDGRLTYITFNNANENLKFHSEYVSRSQKQEKKKLLGQINSVSIVSINKKPVGIVSGTFQVQVLNLQKRKMLRIYKGFSCSPITMARIHPNGIHIIYVTGNDWVNGILELKDSKKPMICVGSLKKEDHEKLKQ